jgi:hypothetical protein
MSRFSHISVAAMGKLEIPKGLDDATNALAGTPMLDGIPMKSQLHAFCTELRKKFPKIKFHFNSDYNKISNIQLVVADVLVYVDDCDYVLGRIGHGYYGVNINNDVPEFMVESRKIKNDKYAEYRDQYHRVFTKDMDKALKNAQRYLLPYSPNELLLATFGAFKDKLDTRKIVADRAFEQAIGSLTGYQVLAAELENLVNQGVKFSTSPFQLHAEEAVAKYQHRQYMRNKQTRSYFITIRMIGDTQVADVATCHDYKGKSPLHQDFFEESFKVMNVDDLPEDIKAKIATLMLVDVNQHIDGVGIRASERSFWVERDA